MKDPVYSCPQCGETEELTVEAHTGYYVNSGDHYCHLMKTHDPGAPCSCHACNWSGMRIELLKDKK